MPSSEGGRNVPYWREERRKKKKEKKNLGHPPLVRNNGWRKKREGKEEVHHDLHHPVGKSPVPFTQFIKTRGTYSLPERAQGGRSWGRKGRKEGRASYLITNHSLKGREILLRYRRGKEGKRGKQHRYQPCSNRSGGEGEGSDYLIVLGRGLLSYQQKGVRGSDG